MPSCEWIDAKVIYSIRRVRLVAHDLGTTTKLTERVMLGVPKQRRIMVDESRSSSPVKGLTTQELDFCLISILVNYLSCYIMVFSGNCSLNTYIQLVLFLWFGYNTL